MGKNQNCSSEIKEKVRHLTELNRKLTSLHWISAQIAAEQDIKTMYNLIVNGFSEITGVDKCGFYLVKNNQFVEATNRNKKKDEPFWGCTSILDIFKQVLHERVAVLNLEEKLCSGCSSNCGIIHLRTCTLYDKGGNPTGLLVAYDFQDNEFSYDWIKILELYTMQISLALENAILNSRLRDLAIKDGLTGLYNHRCLMDDLDKTILRCCQNKEMFCLLLIDVDDFKKYNDSFGHPAGDKVLETLASIMMSTVKDTGTVYRYGGEEFAVLLPGYTRDEGFMAAEEIRKNIARYNFLHRNITVSIGIAEYPYNAQQTSKLIECADQALYLAKNNGKNLVCSSENCSK